MTLSYVLPVLVKLWIKMETKQDSFYVLITYSLDRTLVSGGYDEAICVWDVTSCAKLLNLKVIKLI